ncbi:GNAT family N-acetyltransferase [Donghicola sp. C2-DW-16]|uniref:GNAT family N-acetyltransferase n=1 Tax=Donghicola mangrovi TaxID=2729614 RepID=A0ABX2PB60_9RHOB|nr:GNAT family N-acetyltransferase [Donghicola mangrovi]NVO26613.1 GNAT family N-acetyltransferase [Donghicola mangrovi]
MTPQELADLHHKAMTETRPWTDADFADLLAQPDVFVVGDLRSFALGRVVLDEAELLTIVTDPDLRRQGLGAQTLSAFDTEAIARGAVMGFLEVSVENQAATALYLRSGWTRAGTRKCYYHLQDGRVVDALVMSRSLAQ